jgi:hypothetical protein
MDIFSNALEIYRGNNLIDRFWSKYPHSCCRLYRSIIGIIFSVICQCDLRACPINRFTAVNVAVS